MDPIQDVPPAPVSSDQANTDQEAKDLKAGSNALSAITARESEFEKGWWAKAKDALKIYSSEGKNAGNEDVPYNILYSNTEVLLPSLYSATPKPDVRTRFKDQNLKPIPDVVSRFLLVVSDPASPGGETFDGAMQDAVLSSLVPGMGYVRLRYRENQAFPIQFESGKYDTLIWGKATKWSKVPWLAFKHVMPKEQMFQEFNIPPEEQVNYKPSSEAEDDKSGATIYEFWDKRTRQVLFVCDSWQKKLLLRAGDPLGLENFYPTPGLLMMTMKSGRLIPTTLYQYYINQAEELNRVTVRLKNVLSAIRVRGFYNTLLGDDMKKLLTTDGVDGNDNILIGASEGALLSQTGGVDKHIWLLPIENLIVVAKELYSAREAIKQVIYDITGISDIIRGSSAPSETATAQDLKNKWGTVRLRRMQTVVANYARDLFRMAVDCGSDHIPATEWQKITQMVSIPTAQQKQTAKDTLDRFAQIQAQMQRTQPPPIPGAPPAMPPQPDPSVIQAQQVMQAPLVWEQLLDTIKNDMSRTFVVNIQTSSTIDLDTAQDKSEVAEFMTAVGQLVPALSELGSLGGSGLEAAKGILIAVCQRYKFGLDVVDLISAIQAPPPPPPEPPKGPPPPLPEEIQAKQMTANASMADAQSKQRLIAANEELELMKINASKAQVSRDIQMADLRLQEQQIKLQTAREKATLQKSAPVPA